MTNVQLRKDSENIYIKLPKNEVVFFCGFFEGYEGMAVLRTPVRLEGPQSIIKLILSPDFKKEVNQLLKYLKKTIPIQRLRHAVVETQ